MSSACRSRAAGRAAPAARTGPDEWASVDGLRALMHVAYDALALLGRA